MYGMVLNLTGCIFGNPAYANQNNDPYTYPPNWNALKDVTTVSGRPEAIDELWHATINGRGQMLLASSPEDTRDAILTIVANVVSKGGAAAAVAVSNPNPVAGDNFAYASNYNSGAWSGDINAYTLDLTTGQPSTTPNWNPSPQHLLAGRDYTTRVIATYNGTAGVPFQWSSLSTTQQGQLGTSVTGPDVLSFLRGNRTKEGVTFRGRGPRAPYPNNVVSDNVAVLGDIVNAEPIYIGAPRFSYMDSGYAAFKTGAAATRTKTVYQGANDGMLHAFDATTGAESWAYIPNAVFPNLAQPQQQERVRAQVLRRRHSGVWRCGLQQYQRQFDHHTRLAYGSGWRLRQRRARLLRAGCDQPDHGRRERAGQQGAVGVPQRRHCCCRTTPTWATASDARFWSRRARPAGSCWQPPATTTTPSSAVPPATARAICSC